MPGSDYVSDAAATCGVLRADGTEVTASSTVTLPINPAHQHAVELHAPAATTSMVSQHILFACE